MIKQSEVTFTENSISGKTPVVQFLMLFHFRNGWNKKLDETAVDKLTPEEKDLLNRIIYTVEHRWHKGCNSDLQLFLLNLKPNYQTDNQWFSIVAAENHNMVVLFGRDFGNIDYPVMISVYR